MKIERVVREMNPARVTEQEGHWLLRHAVVVDDAAGDDISVFLVSERAAAGTLASDLKPTALEFLGLESDELTLPLAMLAELSAWPTAQGSPA